ncbi:hypothetical protein [Kitasatospora sp. McL0602]|uniref:hypothetical protein n=1 Tax=Kitasatospora sp. McL0602 TaxID=3439530 RepID=UPI003F8C0677
MTDPVARSYQVKGEVAAFRGELVPARAATGLWPYVELLPAPGSPAPEGVAPRHAADGSVVGYPLPPDRLDAWYAVHWTFRWRGELFECTHATDSTVAGNYLGDDASFAKEHLKRRVRGYRGEFPRGEVTELTEHREDLLGPLTALVRRLVEANHFRPETYAVHRGRAYPAAAQADASGRIALTGVDLDMSDLPADPQDPTGRRHLAAPEQLDAWCRTHWTFSWQGGPFDAVGTAEGRIKGVYTGASWGFVDGFQLTQETAPDGAHTCYTVEVDLDGVTDLEQHRTDLLAADG